jgi:hypothetical protein
MLSLLPPRPPQYIPTPVNCVKPTSLRLTSRRYTNEWSGKLFRAHCSGTRTCSLDLLPDDEEIRISVIDHRLSLLAFNPVERNHIALHYWGALTVLHTRPVHLWNQLWNYEYFTQSKELLGGGYQTDARLLLTITQTVDRHKCLKWDSNPRFQCLVWP